MMNKNPIECESKLENISLVSEASRMVELCREDPALDAMMRDGEWDAP